MEEYLAKLAEPERVKALAMDMHEEPFRQAVQMCLPQAKVVTDKFHLIRHINGALEKVRSRLREGVEKGRGRNNRIKMIKRMAYCQRDMGNFRMRISATNPGCEGRVSQLLT